jgi:adenosylmethionine-8-amino-7-oxononanoate aminotransferase
LEAVLARAHDQLAALVIEPLVQGAAGMILQPPGYLRGVRELTRRYDLLLIADEIVTGCGRTGRMFACEHEQVAPDLLCLGKSLTAGYLPMAATIATEAVYQAFLGDYTSGVTFHHGHTFGGNPLAAAAACASLDLVGIRTSAKSGNSAFWPASSWWPTGKPTPRTPQPIGAAIKSANAPPLMACGCDRSATSWWSCRRWPSTTRRYNC